MRPQADSGLIDLVAINRDARAAQARLDEDARKQVSETPPPMVLGGERPADDVDEFAARLASPWSRGSRLKMLVGGGCATGVLVAALFVAIGGTSADQAQAAAKAAAAAPKVEPVAVAVAAAPPPPPAAVAEPAKVEAKVQQTAVKPTQTASRPAAKAAPRKAAPKRGPKLMKVQSSGVEAAKGS